MHMPGGAGYTILRIYYSKSSNRVKANPFLATRDDPYPLPTVLTVEDQ